jgi:energy-converting hydrogenase Eha subunit A
MVTLSLYNPCLILENSSLIGIFRRSHTLVSGARLRFVGIYFLTGWITAVITSVLTGVALLVFSVFISELAPVREALSSLKFLTLFIGADVEVVLPQVLGTPATVAILVVKGLIATFLVPIWAILTTRLYLERVEAIREATLFQ